MIQTAPYNETTSEALMALRDAALAHLSGDPVAYDAVGAVAALDALDLSAAAAASPLALEAFAAVVIARGRRPRRAQKPLYRLFQARLAAGEQPAYFEFADRISAAAEHGFSLEGVIFNRPLTDVDQPQLWRDTQAALAAVAEVFGPAFLNSGTLLGAVREGRFIDHDDDVDIAVLMPATSAEDAAQQWAAGIATLIARGVVEKRARRNLGMFKLNSTSGVNIDVFPAWIVDDRLYLYPHTSGELSRDDLLPLAACKTTGLPIPRNAEGMLVVNYGPGWRKPDPGFAFAWAAANKKFADFRTALDKAGQS
ncbi:LicD family protein [Sulfitobacter sp.]|uniref:LicD family protein n=1 Tax=Sulfitobacter sp. TaxID=1903071 RepID=UPI0030030EE3